MRILITGASRGIGKALCLEALKRGATVHAIVRKASDVPSGCTAHVADVRDRGAMGELLKQLASQVDWFIANAGIGESLSPRDQKSAEKAAEVLDVNATSAIYSSYIIANEWIGRGEKDKKIALVSSLAAGRGLPKTSVYSASKAALVSFAQGFERDVAKYGISVSLVQPGFVDTDMTKDLASRPFLVTPQEAAKAILNGMEEGKPLIIFPKKIAAVSWVRDHIPYFMFRWTVTQLQKRKIL